MTDFTEQHDEQIFRYLRQQLGADEKAQFEIRMLEEPELLERVQLLEALQLGMRAEEKDLLAGAAPQPVSKVLPFRAWLRQPLSLAASVLVAALGVNAYLGTRSANAPDAIPVGALLLLDTRRDTAIPAFAGMGPYLLQIDAGLGTDTASMQLTLRDTAGAALLQREMSVDGDGWIRLLYTQPLDGEYQVDLEWTDGTGTRQTLSYPFSVRNP